MRVRPIYRKPYKKKFAKKPNVRSKVVGTAARGAATNYLGTAICKDLGSVTPNCMVAKVRLHFLTGATGGAVTSLNGTITGDKRTLLSINFVPFHGDCLNQTTPDTGYTANNVDAVGMSRLLGSAGGTAFYSRCAVLRVQGSLVVSGWADSSSAAVAPTPGIAGHILWRMHDNTEGGLTSTVTQAAADVQFAQPNTRRRMFQIGYSSVYDVSGTPAFQHVPLPSPVRCRIRVDSWIHQILDMNFASYVSDASSFGSSSASPANYAMMDISTFFNSLNGGNVVPNRMHVQGDLTFTCLFKDPLATIT